MQIKIFLIKLQTFVKSLFFHIVSGLPKSTQEEINQRYSICLQCDKFDKTKSQCMMCGCNITRKSQFLNKLAWADQECPIGNWTKINRKSKK